MPRVGPAKRACLTNIFLPHAIGLQQGFWVFGRSIKRRNQNCNHGFYRFVLRYDVSVITVYRVAVAVHLRNCTGRHRLPVSHQHCTPLSSLLPSSRPGKGEEYATCALGNRFTTLGRLNPGCAFAPNQEMLRENGKHYPKSAITPPFRPANVFNRIEPLALKSLLTRIWDELLGQASMMTPQ
ncbi:hypothetical protein M426DRAFT_179480 [Hypoxylon sp. CI-4A]|nr:hypothetical protein M426DRAFT_179480 [Hypoxylon sp. CI-4A]